MRKLGYKTVKYFLNKQFFIFVLVGILNTIFGYSVFAFFIWLGFHYTLAVLLGTCAGVIFNFKTIGKIVFKNSNNKLIIKFIFIYAVLYFFNILIIKILLIADVNIYIAGAIATVLAAIVSFFLNKEFVFRG